MVREDPPKYLQVLATIQERISDGTWPAGTMIPSEHQMANDFDVSRPTVLKALAILKTDGWIESQKGKGHFVRGMLPTGRHAPAHARAALDLDEAAGVKMLHVGPVLADARTADLLRIPAGTPVYQRKRCTVIGGQVVDIVTTNLPVEVAVNTDAIKQPPVQGGLLAHIAARRGIHADYATDWTTARLPSEDEAQLLGIGLGDPVISVVVAAYTAAGEPVAVSSVVAPGATHELEDSYPLP